MGEPFAVSKCQEPGCKDAVETVGTWSSRLCLKHRRARFGWERSDYEAEARRMLEVAERNSQWTVEHPDDSRVSLLARLAETAVASAAVYAQLAQGSDCAPPFAALARGSDEPFPPGQPLQPFRGYSRKPPA